MKAAIVCVLLLFATYPSARTLGVQDQGSLRNKPFSRSAWIAAHMGATRFSGGVLPSINRLSIPPAPEQSIPSIQSTVPTSVLANITATPPVQVSSDLIPSDTSAQPGSHAEPYIDADPLNPMNLVGGWQENRFENGGARCLSYGT
ncbi:MAG: hypothetical protein ACREDR_05150, partial [Blastocatellia bacterium]